MQRLKLVFKDVNSLHARINTIVSNSSVLKVGIIPHNGRDQAKNVLDALMSDPIQLNNWNVELSKRNLNKDTLVVQSPAFNYIENHNSLAVYPIPFPGPPIEYLEVSNVKDSIQRLIKCHLILDIFDKPPLPVKDELTDFPRLTILDAVENSEEKGIHINSSLALKASELLQTSPQNVTKFIELKNSSNIDELKNILSDRDAVNKLLMDSIFSSCRKQISDLKNSISVEEVQTAAKQRQQWTELAYTELEEMMSKLRKLLYKRFSWYKLYFRNDDLDQLSSILNLPNSVANFEYLRGLQSKSKDLKRVDIPRNSSIDNLLDELKSSSLKAVLTALGVQVPVALGSLVLYFGGMSGTSMTALAFLGLVVGFRRLQSQWINASNKFERNVKQSFMDFIQERAVTLFNSSEESEVLSIKQVKEMETVLNEVESEIKK